MQEEIRKVSDDLAEMEFSGHHRWATIPPKRNEITNSQHELLDTLARFLTETRDVCVAVYYKEGRLIVANNWRRPNYAGQCLDVLKTIANVTNSEEKTKVYQELVWQIIVKQIYDLVTEKVKEKIDAQEKNRMIKGEKEAFDKLKDFKAATDEYKNNYHKLKRIDNQSLLSELLEKVKISAKEFFREVKNLPEKNRLEYWECLSPLEDLNIIIDAIIAHNKSNKKEELIEAIKKGEVDCIEGEICGGIKEVKKKKGGDESYKDYETCTNYRGKKECEICEKNVVHAEMKIIRETYKKKSEEKSSSSMMEVDEPLFEYIGISKLACLPCQITIEVLNPEKKEKCICGTHGSTYRSWEVPHNIPDDSKKEILRRLKELCLHEKVLESTSKFPEGLTEINLVQNYQGEGKIIHQLLGIQGSSKS